VTAHKVATGKIAKDKVATGKVAVGKSTLRIAFDPETEEYKVQD